MACFLIAAASGIEPPVDLDGDGLGDFWQVKHGITAANAGLDDDGDGYTAEEEHAFGTDPGDGGSRLAPAVVEGTTAPVFRWDSVRGIRYRVETGIALDDFASQETLTGTGGLMDWDFPAGPPRAFARLAADGFADSDGDGYGDSEEACAGEDPDTAQRGINLAFESGLTGWIADPGTGGSVTNPEFPAASGKHVGRLQTGSTPVALRQAIDFVRLPAPASGVSVNVSYRFTSSAGTLTVKMAGVTVGTLTANASLAAQDMVARLNVAASTLTGAADALLELGFDGPPGASVDIAEVVIGEAWKECFIGGDTIGDDPALTSGRNSLDISGIDSAGVTAVAGQEFTASRPFILDEVRAITNGEPSNLDVLDFRQFQNFWRIALTRAEDWFVQPIPDLGKRIELQISPYNVSYVCNGDETRCLPDTQWGTSSTGRQNFDVRFSLRNSPIYNAELPPGNYVLEVYVNEATLAAYGTPALTLTNNLGPGLAATLLTNQLGTTPEDPLYNDYNWPANPSGVQWAISITELVPESVEGLGPCKE